MHDLQCTASSDRYFAAIFFRPLPLRPFFSYLIRSADMILTATRIGQSRVSHLDIVVVHAEIKQNSINETLHAHDQPTCP